MHSIQSVCDFLEAFAPAYLAEEWDNVGLLVGDAAEPVQRVMTCLTITPQSAQEAIRQQAQLIVSHHPLPFRALKQLTSHTVPGRLLWQLARHGIAVYSPHTAFDSTSGGINHCLAEGLGLTELAPLQLIVPPGADRVAGAEPNATERPRSTPPEAALGAGRYGKLPSSESLQEFAERLKQFLGLNGLFVVGPGDQRLEKVAVACGSAGQFLHAAKRLDCDALVTGETNFHTCLEAEAEGIALLLPGHFASEHFAVERLAGVLQTEFPSLNIWPSRDETDPLKWV